MAINCFTFTGNIGRDPELKTLPNGTSVLNFSVAAASGFGDKKNTFWVRCAMFGSRAEAMGKYLRKGLMVAVSGELNLRTFDARDGSKGTSLELNVHELQLMNTRGAENQPTPGQPSPNQPAAQRPAPAASSEPETGEDDKLPF